MTILIKDKYARSHQLWINATTGVIVDTTEIWLDDSCQEVYQSQLREAEDADYALFREYDILIKQLSYMAHHKMTPRLKCKTTRNEQRRAKIRKKIKLRFQL